MDQVQTAEHRAMICSNRACRCTPGPCVVTDPPARRDSILLLDRVTFWQRAMLPGTVLEIVRRTTGGDRVRRRGDV